MTTLLVVDLSATNRLQLKLLGERLGHRVVGASSKVEAATLMATERPDVVLIELGRIRDDSDALIDLIDDLPIIVVANTDESGRAEWFRESSEHDVLLRPIDRDSLNHALTSALSRRSVPAVANGKPAVAETSTVTPAASHGLLHLYAALGHDLRTPLNAILGFSDMLADEIGEMGELGLALDVKRIHAAGQRMLAMVDEVVDLARADLGQLSLVPQSFPLREAIATLMSEIQGDTSLPVIEIIVEFDSNVPRQITTDARRFRQTLITLVKLVRQGGAGPARLSSTRSGDHLIVSLTAPKFGLTAPEIEQALGPLDGAEPGLLAKSGGLCLSLALGQRVTHLMGGSIRVTTTDETMSLQMSIPHGTEVANTRIPIDLEAPSVSVEANARPLKILLAEDSPVNQSLIRSILKRIGREADIASNGLEVLAMLRKSSYDVILMDINMPQMDGLEAAEKIRTGWPEATRPRIIALTGAVNPKDIEACRDAGMIDYLAKPIQSPALKAALERLL